MEKPAIPLPPFEAGLFRLPGTDLAALQACLVCGSAELVELPVQGMAQVLAGPLQAERRIAVFYVGGQRYLQRRMAQGQAPVHALVEWNAMISRLLEVRSRHRETLLLVDESILWLGTEEHRRQLQDHLALRVPLGTPEFRPDDSSIHVDLALREAISVLTILGDTEARSMMAALEAGSLCAPSFDADPAVASLLFESFRHRVALRPSVDGPSAIADGAQGGPGAALMPDDTGICEKGAGGRQPSAIDEEIQLLHDYIGLLQAEILAGPSTSKDAHAADVLASGAGAPTANPLVYKHEPTGNAGGAESARLHPRYDAPARRPSSAPRDRQALQEARDTIERLTREIDLLLEQTVRGVISATARSGAQGGGVVGRLARDAPSAKHPASAD